MALLQFNEPKVHPVWDLFQVISFHEHDPISPGFTRIAKSYVCALKNQKPHTRQRGATRAVPILAILG